MRKLFLTLFLFLSACTFPNGVRIPPVPPEQNLSAGVPVFNASEGQDVVTEETVFSGSQRSILTEDGLEMIVIDNQTSSPIHLDVALLRQIRNELGLTQVAKVIVRPDDALNVETREDGWWYVTNGEALEINALVLGLMTDGSQESYAPAFAYSPEAIRAHGLWLALALQGSTTYSEFVAHLNGYTYQENLYLSNLDIVQGTTLVGIGLPIR